MGAVNFLYNKVFVTIFRRLWFLHPAVFIAATEHMMVFCHIVSQTLMILSITYFVTVQIVDLSINLFSRTNYFFKR